MNKNAKKIILSSDNAIEEARQIGGVISHTIKELVIDDDNRLFSLCTLYVSHGFVILAFVRRYFIDRSSFYGSGRGERKQTR